MNLAHRRPGTIADLCFRLKEFLGEVYGQCKTQGENLIRRLDQRCARIDAFKLEISYYKLVSHVFLRISINTALSEIIEWMLNTERCISFIFIPEKLNYQTHCAIIYESKFAEVFSV